MATYHCFLVTEPEHDDRKRMGMKVNISERGREEVKLTSTVHDFACSYQE